MKTIIKLLIAVAIFGSATSSYAALNYYLTIKGQKSGKSVTVPVRCGDGSCSKMTWTVDISGPDVYLFTLTDAQGNPLQLGGKSLDRGTSARFSWTVSTPRDPASGQSTGRMESTTTTTTTSSTTGVVSPRDPASGLPTGKRMHKPFVITKELDRATPLLSVSSSPDCDGPSTLTGAIEWTWTDGGIMANDDWSVPASK